MIWKRAYLDGSALAKVRYRGLQKSGEAALLHGADLAIAPWSRELLEAGVPTASRQRRDRNVRLFFSMTSENERFRPVAAPQPTTVPFNAVIVFDSSVERELVRRRLIRERVYGSVHWAQPLSAPARVQDLAKRILTIPVDQRYDEGEVARICEILTSPDQPARARLEWRASERALD